MKKPKILYLVTEDWYFWSHRLSLAQEAKWRGYEVLVVTRVNQHGDRIREQGFRVIDLNMQRRGMNIFKGLAAILEVVKIYKREQPDIVHHVAIKPALYGSIAAFIARIPGVINAITGMGYLFISKGFKVCIIRTWISCLFRFLFRKNKTYIIFQNSEDMEMFIISGIVRKNQACLIRGSGVNVDMFVTTPEPPEPIIVVLPARMLYDKGVKEFIDAARILMRKNYKTRCILVGDRDPENPAVVSKEQIQQWQEEQVVEFLGHQVDMPSVLAKAHIVCLPSYREGLPKALLEAASCGKPIVATDVPGCREIVQEGINGFLVPPKNSVALAEALIKLITNKELRLKMGSRGREIVLRDFSEKKVVTETLAIYQRILAK